MADTDNNKNTAEKRVAGHPFDDPKADVIIYSEASHVEFRIHRIVLILASPYFRDVLTPTEAAEELQEEERILELLLKFTYPASDLGLNTLASLEETQILLEAAKKYQLACASHRIQRLMMVQFGSSEPMRVYALACTYGSEEIAAMAAKLALEIPLMEIPLFPELACMSGAAYHLFLDYRRRCAEAALETMQSDEWTEWSKGSWTWFHCDKCTGATSDLARKYRRDGKNWKPAIWWVDYVDRAIEAFKWGKCSPFVLKDDNFIQPSVDIADRCFECRMYAHYDLVAFSQRWAEAVERVLSQVQLSCDALPSKFVSATSQMVKSFSEVNHNEHRPGVPETDLVLRSETSDADFYAHRAILQLSSPFFRDMLSLPQPRTPSHTRSEVADASGVAIIPFQEQKAVVMSLLGFIYPYGDPIFASFSSLEDVRHVLEAAKKYQLKGAITNMQCIMALKFASTDCIGTYALACAYELEDAAHVAAGKTLEIPVVELPFSPQLTYMSGVAYHYLLDYRRRCGEAAEEIIHDSFWPYFEASPSDWPWWCTMCDSQRDSSFGEGREDEYGNTLQPATYWVDYRTRAIDAFLSGNVSTSILTDADLVRSFSDRAITCRNCEDPFKKLRDFGALWGVKVREAVSAVELRFNP